MLKYEKWHNFYGLAKPLAEVKSNFSNNSSEKDTVFENNINIKVNITVSQQTHAKNLKVFANDLQKNVGKFNNYVPVKRNLNENREKNCNNTNNNANNHMNNINSNNANAKRKIIVNEKIANKNKTNTNNVNNIANASANTNNSKTKNGSISQHKNNFQANVISRNACEKKEDGGNFAKNLYFIKKFNILFNTL